MNKFLLEEGIILLKYAYIIFCRKVLSYIILNKCYIRLKEKILQLFVLNKFTKLICVYAFKKTFKSYLLISHIFIFSC